MLPTHIPTFHTPQMQIIDKIQWYNFDIPQVNEHTTLFNYPMHYHGISYSTNFIGNGVVTSWEGGNISAHSSRTTFPGLMINESGAVYFVQTINHLTISGGISADKYGFFRRLNTIYGIYGSATFYINDNISFTAFGSHYSNSVYYSPATMPYINQSSYGGYMGLWFNEYIGIDLGIQRTINPWNDSHETVPIVRPTFKFNNETEIDFDVGYLLKDAIFNNSHSNPTMSPPRAIIPITNH